MRNIFTAVLTAAFAICFGLQAATASLLGMPLNLRSAINQVALSKASTNSCEGYTADMFIGIVPGTVPE
jgi:hypothetical protein